MSLGTEMKSSLLGDHLQKHKKLVLEVSIVANATPASKSESSDLPGIMFVRSEGRTALADAVELVSFTAPVDATNAQFGLLLEGANLVSDGSSIKKVLKVAVSEQTALASSLTVAKVGGDYLTSGGNIAIDILGTGLSLDSESPTFLVEVDYLES